MSDFPWLSALILLPLAGAVAVALLPRQRSGESGAVPSPLAKQVGLGVSLLTAVIAVIVAVGYEAGGGWQFTEKLVWVAPLGVHYALGVDGLGLLMVLLTVLLVPIVLVAGWRDADSGNGPVAFTAWTLALQAFSLAVFTTTDVFLFYVVFEATLIPAYFLIAGFGREGRQRAAVKFLVYQLAGGLIMLASVIGLYVVAAGAGSVSYLITDLQQLDIDPVTQRWLFLGFFIAFAIKAPMFPVHTWLADTTEKATTGTAVLLVCILDKIGTFGMIRFCLGLFPDASQWATPVVVIFALISIIYGALVAIGQDDVLRLIGLTSLSHFGFIVLGIFVFSSQGMSGSVLYMVNHGIGTAALFLLAGYLIRRSGTPLISQMGGLEKTVPVLAGLFLVAGLAACGLPGLSPFVSEFLVMVAAFKHAWWVGAVAVLAIVLAAVYILRTYQRAFTGPPLEAYAGARDLSRRELTAVAPLIALLIVFGFYPRPLLDVINPMVEATMSHVGVSDSPAKVQTAEVAETEGSHE